MNRTEVTAPNSGRSRRAVVVAVLVFFAVVVVGASSILFLASDSGSDSDPQVAAESTQEPVPEATATKSPATVQSTPTEVTTAEIEPTPTPETSDSDDSDAWDDPTTVLVEHCQMSIQVPGNWRQGTNEYGALYVANYSEDTETGPDGVTVELCPLREGDFTRSGLAFEFPGGYEGQIFRGSIYEEGDPERDLDLLYFDNRVTWFLSASFVEPATEANPATAEFFEIVDTIEYYDDGLQGEPDTSPADPVAPESPVDPLFVTYVCDERQSLEYTRAVEEWGYLTHAGKELMCHELLGGNHEFVLHHQKLIEQSEIINATILIGHDNDPHSWYLNSLASANVNPFGDFGAFILESYPYDVIDLLIQAHTPSDEALTILHAASFVDGWSSWWMGQESDNSRELLSTGALLAKSLNGDTGTHFSRRLDQANGADVEYQLIGALIESASIGRRNRASRQALMGSYEHTFLMYRANTSNSTFHEWLVRNPDTFLNQHWPDEDWTLPHP